jgi:A/G-specific adenine glycosylase
MLQHSLLASADDAFLQTANEARTRFNNEGLSDQIIANVRECIWSYHAASRRPFPWRNHINPYHVVVSEVMLQQTQTSRVEQKFSAFVERFPSFESLANASFDEVLRYWKGLGYNRRAKNLQRIAQALHTEHGGTVPTDPALLQKLPGLGAATAASICTFAHDIPTVFLETNVRTVLIYFFFDTSSPVHDKELFPLARLLLDKSRPREWYYALMDVGVLLKKRVGNFSQLSKAYTRQSKFEGSRRQIRGKILELLLATPTHSAQEIELLVNDAQGRTSGVIEELLAEQFIVLKDNKISLKK